jgi:hypothetical protein
VADSVRVSRKSHVILCLLCILALIISGKAYSQELGQEFDLQAYLLPDNHPIKSSLDSIFSQSRACLDIKSMKKAGFANPKPRKFTRLIVTSHPLLKGYIVKLYLDAQRHYKRKTELGHWSARILGAHYIREYIDKNNLHHLFKIPHKWIYRLPDMPKPPRELNRKEYILICEDMQILDRKQNQEAWSSNAVTPELLSHLYNMLNDLGLHDCGSIDNIPFTTDGRIAFIDTETYGEWPVNYKRLSQHLSLEMKTYWTGLIKN